MKYKLALISLLFSTHCLSEGVRLGFAVGKSDVDLEPNIYDSDHYSVDEPTSILLYAGYLFENGVILDFAHNSLTDDILFGALDNIRLDSSEVLIGYKFKHHDFYFEPKLGYARWNLRLKEGELFNPGPELESKDSGSDPLLALTAGISISSSFGMSLSYRYQDFEIGDVATYDLGFDLQF